MSKDGKQWRGSAFRRIPVMRRLSSRDLLTTLRRVSRYSLITGIGVVLGFLREIVVASTFGLSSMLDAFVAARTFYMLLGMQVGNALESVFVSKISKYKNYKTTKSALKVAARSLFLFNVIAALALLVGVAPFVAFAFPGFSPADRELVIQIAHVLIIAIALANFAGLLRAGLLSLRVYWPGFLSGSLISVATIIVVTFFADLVGVYALPLGLITGQLLVVVLYLQQIRAAGSKSSVSTEVSHPASPLVLWGPVALVLIGEAIYQALGVTSNGFASKLEEGTIAAFYFSSAILAIPGALVIGPLSTYLFPSIAAQLSHEDTTHGFAMVWRYVTIVFGFGLALAIGMSSGASFMVESVFVRGHFSVEDAALTSKILSITAYSLPFFGVEKILRYAMYGLGDYRSPIYCNLISWLFLFGAAILLVQDFGVFGLALASVISNAGGVLLMAIIIARRQPQQPWVES